MPAKNGRYYIGYIRSEKYRDCVGVNEIADLLGGELKRNTVGNWAKRWADWPKPLYVLSCGSVYSLKEVQECLKAHGRLTDTVQGG